MTPTIEAPFSRFAAGAGGDEAALFASDLFRMYSLHARARGWRFAPRLERLRDGRTRRARGFGRGFGRRRVRSIKV